MFCNIYEPIQRVTPLPDPRFESKTQGNSNAVVRQCCGIMSVFRNIYTGKGNFAPLLRYWLIIKLLFQWVNNTYGYTEKILVYRCLQVTYWPCETLFSSRSFRRYFNDGFFFFLQLLTSDFQFLLTEISVYLIHSNIILNRMYSKSLVKLLTVLKRVSLVVKTDPISNIVREILFLKQQQRL